MRPVSSSFSKSSKRGSGTFGTTYIVPVAPHTGPDHKAPRHRLMYLRIGVTVFWLRTIGSPRLQDYVDSIPDLIERSVERDRQRGKLP